MISKKAAAAGAVVIILMTAFFSSVITLKAHEFYMVREGDAITSEEYTELKDFYKKLNQVREIVLQDYIEEPDQEAMMTGAIKGLVSSLGDPYTYYLTPEEYKEMMISIQGSYAGIGLSVTVNKETNEIIVQQVYEGTPAEEVGILKNDVLIEVDGHKVDAAMYETAVNLMRGEPTTTVEIALMRDGSGIDLEVERQIIEYPDLEYRMIDNDIGYIWLYRFDEGSSDNFQDAVDDLLDQGMKGLVLDLRTNPGGMLTECTKIADKLLPEGLILYSEDRQGNREEYKSEAEHLNIPLAVLVNQQSASASEVLAAAIQDYGVGSIIGTTTFGKGLVQTIRGPFKEGDVLKITTSRYFSPKGRDIDQKGVQPDIVAETTDEAIEYMTDNPGEELPLELDAVLVKAMEEISGHLDK